MGYPSMNNISHYNQVNRESGIADASPHRLVQMLLEGALKKIAIVKGLIQRHDIARKGEMIGQAISIVEGLRSSLNQHDGGEIAVKLNHLYEYIEQRLIQANIKNDTAILDEVAGLLKEVKTGWDGIPQTLRQANNAEPAAASV